MPRSFWQWRRSLDDLLDVDLNPTRSSFVVVENEFTWLHYKKDTPDAGEISNSGDALVLHKQAWGGIDPSDLINPLSRAQSWPSGGCPWH